MATASIYVCERGLIKIASPGTAIIASGAALLNNLLDGPQRFEKKVSHLNVSRGCHALSVHNQTFEQLLTVDPMRRSAWSDALFELQPNCPLA